MPRDYSRSRRVEEQILRLLAELVRREVKDPRVGLVTLTAVEVSKDLSHATVFFLPFEAQRDAAEVGAALASAAGFLRIQLKRALSMRHVPELRFRRDESIDRAARLSALIGTAVKSDVERHVDEPDASDASEPADGGASDSPAEAAERAAAPDAARDRHE